MVLGTGFGGAASPRASLSFFLFFFKASFSFRFSCLYFMNIKCRRCLFFISDTLNGGGNDDSGSAFAFSDSLTAPFSTAS
uniref:Uncharacterized protein n=1 Tax=Anguilla anguilla TaxID=7936 RepID=A0A0E9XE00_ANGAN